MLAKLTSKNQIFSAGRLAWIRHAWQHRLDDDRRSIRGEAGMKATGKQLAQGPWNDHDVASAGRCPCCWLR